MSGRLRKLIRSHARLALSRAVLVLAAVAVLLAVVRGGTRFFYCSMTHLSFDAPPCSSSPSPPSPPSSPSMGEAGEMDDSDGPAVRTADCCVEKWRAAAPTASTPNVEATSIAPAGVLAVLPSPQLDIAMASAKVPFGLANAVRAGPPPPSAGRRRAELMVFHI